MFHWSLRDKIAFYWFLSCKYHAHWLSGVVMNGWKPVSQVFLKSHELMWVNSPQLFSEAIQQLEVQHTIASWQWLLWCGGQQWPISGSQKSCCWLWATTYPSP
jgi:hypothetical protein